MRTYNNSMPKPNEDPLFLMKRLSKDMHKSMDRETETLGLTPTQGRILFYVCRETRCGNTVTQNDLVNRFHLTKSTVSGYIDRLEGKGFISRVKENRKMKLLPLDKAYELEEEFETKVEMIRQKTYAGFSEGEKEKLINQLQQMIENIEGGN